MKQDDDTPHLTENRRMSYNALISIIDFTSPIFSAIIYA